MELRRWSEDSDQLLRAGYALFYLAAQREPDGQRGEGRDFTPNFLPNIPAIRSVSRRGRTCRLLLAEGNACTGAGSLGIGRRGPCVVPAGPRAAALGQYKDAGASFLMRPRIPHSSGRRSRMRRSARCSREFRMTKTRGWLACARVPGGAAVLDRFDFLFRDASRGAARSCRCSPPDGHCRKFLAARRAGKAGSSRKWDCRPTRLLRRAGPVAPRFDAGCIEPCRAGACRRRFRSSSPIPGRPEAEAEVKRLADDFLKTYPDSTFAPEIHMKLGECISAGATIWPLAGSLWKWREKFPDSPLAEKAVFSRRARWSGRWTRRPCSRRSDFMNRLPPQGGAGPACPPGSGDVVQCPEEAEGRIGGF